MMTGEANYTDSPNWGQSIGAMIGGAVGGPIGGVLGGVLGGILDYALPDQYLPADPLDLVDLLQDVRAALIGEYGTEAIEKFRKFIVGNPTFPMNHDLEKAGRTALQKAIGDIGGERCFPAHWRNKTWEVPEKVVFQLAGYPADLAQEINDCLQGLYGRSQHALELDISIVSTPNFYLAWQPGGAHDLKQDYWEKVLRKDLQPFEWGLFQRAPKFREHLHHHLAERMLVHLGEELKTETKAWRALNRVIFQAIFAELTKLQEGDAQLLAELQETQQQLSAQIEAIDLLQFATVISELGQQATLQTERIELILAQLLKATATVDTLDAKVKVLYHELRSLQKVTQNTYENTHAIRITTNVIAETLTEVQKGLEKLAEEQQRFFHQSPRQARPMGEIPEVERPPFLPDFIGRIKDVTDCRTQLENTGLLIIAGMAGVGKSALAAEIAQQIASPDHIFWHTFRAGEDAYAVIEHLARFLAHRMRSELWYKLQETKTKHFSPREFFDALFAAMHGQNYLLCFDDFHQVDGDGTGKNKGSLDLLVQRVQQATADGHIRVIVTTRYNRSALTRKIPTLSGLSQADAQTDNRVISTLSGLSPADAQLFLEAAGVRLEARVLEKLYQRTEGNVELLQLAAPLIKAEANPLPLIESLAETTSDVGNFLLRKIDQGLKPIEKKVMRGIALLLGYPAKRAAIEAALGGITVGRSLSYLLECHLIRQSGSTAAPRYQQHALVQSYYYDDLDKKQRTVMHRRAALYYQQSEVDPLQAILHADRAGDQRQVRALLLVHVSLLIQQGQAAILQTVVDRLLAGKLTVSEEIELTITSGLLYDALDEREKAQAAFDRALIALALLPATIANRLLMVRAYRSLGKLWELENPPIALAWLQKGVMLLTTDLNDLTPEAQQELAALYIDSGNIELYLGNYSAASDALGQGIEQLPDTATQVHAVAYKALGTIALYRGDLAQAEAYATEALQINSDLSANFEVATMLVNLSAVQQTKGKWVEAIKSLKKALGLAENLNNAELNAAVMLNLGAIYTKLGQDDVAADMLRQSRELAGKYHLYVLEIFANFTLADLYVKSERWTEAHTLLLQAEQRALAVEYQPSLTAIASIRAELLLATQQLASAYEQAQQALSLAQQGGEPLDEGIAYRILGQILVAQHQLEPAFAAFAKSLARLTPIDPYEMARTQVQTGLAFCLTDQWNAGAQLLQEAKAAFTTLGAQRDLAKLEQITPIRSQ